MGENPPHIMLLSKVEYYKRGWLFEASNFVNGVHIALGCSACRNGSLHTLDDP
jgi:hypothetical protein